MTAVPADPRFARAQILFFGIGAQKAGTSWLHHYLSDHPEVCVPPGKELHYWSGLDTDPDARAAEFRAAVARTVAAGGKPDYRRVCAQILETRDPSHKSYADVLFRRYAGQKVVGEITPDYAQLSERTLAQMAALNPDTRFVFLMRDPVDRLHSGIRKRLRSKIGFDRDVAFTGDAVMDELRAILTRRNAAPLRRSRYEQTIRTLEKVVDPARIGLFFYEDIFGGRSTDAICDFLSITRRPGNFDAAFNPGNPVDDARDEQFRAEAMTVLAPTYDYMAARFGDALPAAWRRDTVRA